MRRKDDTLHDTLLDYARNIADTEGIKAVNIRSIAKRSGVATGTVYNYFSGKDEIILELTEEYWSETLIEMKKYVTADSFCGKLEQIFDFLKDRIDSTARMLMRSLENVEAAGHKRMTSMQSTLGKEIIRQMEQDTSVRSDIWNKDFTKEKYAEFIIMNLTSMLRTQAPDIQFLLQIVKRTVY